MSAVEPGQMAAAETYVLFQQNRSLLFQQNRSALFKQNRSVLFQQKSSVLFQQNTSLLLEEQKSVPSLQFRLLKPQIRVWAQNHQNGSKWVQNCGQDPRIGPNESYGCSGAFGMGLAHSIFVSGQIIVKTPDQPPRAAGTC